MKCEVVISLLWVIYEMRQYLYTNITIPSNHQKHQKICSNIECLKLPKIGAVNSTLRTLWVYPKPLADHTSRELHFVLSDKPCLQCRWQCVRALTKLRSWLVAWQKKELRPKRPHDVVIRSANMWTNNFRWQTGNYKPRQK